MKPIDIILEELLKFLPENEADGTRTWKLEDPKVLFLTEEQARSYLDLPQNPSYRQGVYEAETDLLKGSLDSVIKEIESRTKSVGVNVFDLGAGNGEKGVLVAKELKAKGFRVRYCPVDVNSYLLERSRILAEMSGVEVKPFKEEFEHAYKVTRSLHPVGYPIKLVLLLGNSSGNITRSSVWEGIKDGIGYHNPEFLLVGNELRTGKSVAEIMQEYNNEFVRRFFMHPAKILGFKDSDLDYRVVFDEAKGRIEIYYVLNAGRNISSGGIKLKFKPRDEIRVVVSHKYSQEQLTEFLNGMNLATIAFYTNPQQTYALALCQRK